MNNQPEPKFLHDSYFVPEELKDMDIQLYE
jgi:hypothetical protein